MMTRSCDVGFAVLLLSAVACLSTVACSRQPEVDKVSVGQDVALIKADGGVVEGTVTRLDGKTVHVTTGRTERSIPKDQIVDVKVRDRTTPVDLPATARFREYTVPEGTRLSLRLATSINSGTSRVEDPVEATLIESVAVGDAEVLPAGSSLRGVVTAVESSGKVKGLASIRVRFTSVAAAGRNDRYDIDATYAETAEATKRADAMKIGIGAGAGAVIGGLLGGKGGAAKGAAIGGGAGTAVVLSTKGEEVRRPAGARLTVRLKQTLDVRVPVR